MDLKEIRQKALSNLSSYLDLQERAIALGKLADNADDIADYTQVVVELSMGLERLVASTVIIHREAQGNDMEEIELTPEEQASLCQQLDLIRSRRESE